MKGMLPVLVALLGAAGLPLAAQSGWINASPNPRIIPHGQSLCTTTLTWSSSQTQLVQVWVSVSGGGEVLFASSGGGGPYSQSAPWIQAWGQIYSFRLYNYSTGARGALLSLIDVTAISGPSDPCPIAASFSNQARSRKRAFDYPMHPVTGTCLRTNVFIPPHGRDWFTVAFHWRRTQTVPAEQTGEKRAGGQRAALRWQG